MCVAGEKNHTYLSPFTAKNKISFSQTNSERSIAEVSSSVSSGCHHLTPLFTEDVCKATDSFTLPPAGTFRLNHQEEKRRKNSKTQISGETSEPRFRRWTRCKTESQTTCRQTSHYPSLQVIRGDGDRAELKHLPRPLSCFHPGLNYKLLLLWADNEIRKTLWSELMFSASTQCNSVTGSDSGTGQTDPDL